MACIYTYRGHKIGDFVSLLEFLDSKDVSEFNDIADIIYSQATTQEGMAKQIDKLKEDYLRQYKEVEAISSRTNSKYEDELGNPNGVSAQEIIDDPRCKIDGKPIVEPYNQEEYLNVETQNILDKENWGQDKYEQARKEAEKELENHEKIRDMSVTFHKLVDNGYIRGNSKVFVEQTKEVSKGTVFESGALRENLSLQTHIFIKKLKDIHGEDCIIKSNIGVKGKAFDTDIYGHIDYIVIDNQGNAHMYLFKASTKPYSKWSKEKKQKYKYYAAFLKQMLRQNHINVNNMSLNIVPVLFNVSQDYEQLISLSMKEEIQNISVNTKGKYIMDMYDKHASFFIKSDFSPINVSNAEFNKANELCSFIAPNVNLREDGLHKSVEELIRSAPDAGEAEPYTISRLSEGNWRITINSQEFITKSTKPKNSNPEIRKIFEEHGKNLIDNRQQTVATLKNAIVAMAKAHDPESFNKIGKSRGLSGNSSFIQGALRQYTSDYDVDAKRFNWTIIDDLIDYNIVLIKNRLTDQLDVIVLSPYHTNAKIDFHKGTNTILGRYRRDISVPGVMRNTYGNLETLRGILLLNQWLPKMDANTRLGDIKVLSHLGSFQSMSISDITKNQLPKILEVVKEENSDLVINNNFKNLDESRFFDPIESVINQFNRITRGYTSEEKAQFADGKFQDLFNAVEEEDKTAKIVALKNLLKYLGELPQMRDLSPEQIIRIAHSRDYNSNNCRLYLNIERALHYHQGTMPKYEDKLNGIDAKASTTTHVGSENIRVITENAAITFNAISDSVERWHSEHLRGFIRDFQKAKGYSVERNALIGDELSIYKNLYELDDQGQKTMRFKNPFTDPSLNEAEKTFLKKTLWSFYLIRNNFTDVKKLEGPNSEEFQKFVFNHADMLWVPLCRADSSTKTYQNFQKETWKGRFKRMVQVFKDPERAYYEFVERLSEREKQLYESDREHLRISNPFSIGSDFKTREAYIQEEGLEFFETNVDNLLVNYLYQHIKTEKLKDYLTMTKAFLVEMELMGDAAGKGNKFKEQLDYIQQFLTVNVYGGSIKEEFGRAITGLLTPLRTQATLINLGGNIVSFFRDIFQGFQENYIRTITKLNSNIETKYLNEAYAYVITHGITNTMNIDMLSKLQTKYRLSNIDLASSESLKLGRGGIINYRNWAYATLRRPDFLNRMTLFVARCMQDGVWDAYSINNDQLVYDWKKDKRFKALIDGTSQDSAAYKEAKALYMSKIREWNEEHPEHQLPYSPESAEEGLPTPYSNKEILAIKGLADNIYGAYDKMHKSMMEHTTIMWFFGMYTTWMNGIYSNYFMKPGNYATTQLETKQKLDEAGRPLFWTEDFQMVTTNTGMPVYENVPTITQGIWYTIKDIYYIASDEDGGFEKVKEFYQSSPQTKANLRKLLSDMMMCLLMLVLLKGFVLDPTYKDYKKEMKDNPVAMNLLAEVFYKSSTRSWDSFQGPYNYMGWLFENNDSPVYEVNTKIMKDAVKVISGNKSVGDAVVNNFAFTRLGTDTYRAWKRAQD